MQRHFDKRATIGDAFKFGMSLKHHFVPQILLAKIEKVNASVAGLGWVTHIRNARHGLEFAA